MFKHSKIADQFTRGSTKCPILLILVLLQFQFIT